MAGTKKKSTPKTKGKTAPKPSKKRSGGFVAFLRSRQFARIRGAVYVMFSLFLLLALVGYYATDCGTRGRWLGSLGQALAAFFANRLFGIGSLGFSLLFFVYGMRLWDVKVMPWWKTFGSTLFWMLWISLTLGYIGGAWVHSASGFEHFAGIGLQLAEPLHRLLSWWTLVLLLFIAVLFLVLWHWGGMSIDLDSLYNRIASRANQDVLPSKDGLKMLYYTTNTGTSWVAGFSVRFVVELLFMLPLLLLLSAPWIVASRNAGTRIQKARYCLPVLMVVVLTLPIFFRATDYSRWWVCWTFSLAMLPLAATATGDSGLAGALKTLAGYFKKRWYLPLLLVVYLLQFHISDRMFFDGMKESELLIDYIADILL